MFLNDLLSNLRQARATGEVRAAYDEFLQRLDPAQVAAQALKPGERMPEFLLPDADGALLHSAELLAQGPLVVTFIRGDWCPYCSATLDALQAALPQIAAAGGGLAALTPETGGRAFATRQAHGLQFHVLADVDLAIAMAFGVVYRTPPLYEALLRRRGIDLAERSGNPAWFLPVPATFLVGRNGIIARAWVNADFTRRAEPSEVVEALHALRSP